MKQSSFQLAHAMLLAIAGAGVGLTVAAASPDDEAAARKAVPINACSLLTADEVAAVIGIKVDTGARNDGGWVNNDTMHGAYASTCFWRASADRGAADPTLPAGGASFAILNVISWPAGSAESGTFLQQFRDAAERNLIPSKPVPLKIGDEALWWGDGVAVKSGTVAFGISVHLIDGRPKERQMEENLGATLAARVARLKRGEPTS